jgi:hypothetical protein
MMPAIAIHKDVRHSDSSRRETMTTVLPEQYAKSAEDAPSGVSPGCLFVSTSLATWTTANPEQFARDFQINDTVYRRLDPEYYAWLRSRMVLAKKAATAGHLSAAAFEDLRVRFNAVHAWAVEHFSEAQLLAAVRTFRSCDYKPPLPEEFAKTKPVEPVPARTNPESERLPRARGLVDEIRNQALALGWTVESLYFSEGYERGPFAARYGLVCYIGQQDRVGEVTRQSIEIIGPPPMETRSRFYNADVEQPWIIRKTSR